MIQNTYLFILTGRPFYLRSDNFETIFGILGFFHKTNERICFFGLTVLKTNLFVRFFGRIRGYPKAFRNYLTFSGHLKTWQLFSLEVFSWTIKNQLLKKFCNSRNYVGRWITNCQILNMFKCFAVLHTF